MKTRLLTCALLLASLAISAQTTEKKQATVRIKKVENINGVETITDTTFTTDDATALKLGNDVTIQTIDIKGGNEDGKSAQVVIVNGQPMNENESNVKIVHKGDSKEMDAEIEKALKEAGMDPKTKGVKKMIIVDEDTAPGKDGKEEKRITKIVMLNMNITDASPDDVKRLNAGSVDNKVEMDNMKLYPNPNDGKFNLNFNLKNKGDAEVTVYDLQGKQVYNEKLPNFTGEYNKPIDISSNAKGIYFVKIQQGKHTQVKKISLD
jgi:hypothetical protein